MEPHGALLRSHAEERGVQLSVLHGAIVAALVRDAERQTQEAIAQTAVDAPPADRLTTALQRARRALDAQDREAAALVLMAALTPPLPVTNAQVSDVRELVGGLSYWDGARVLAALSVQVEPPIRHTLDVDADRTIDDAIGEMTRDRTALRIEAMSDRETETQDAQSVGTDRSPFDLAEAGMSEDPNDRASALAELLPPLSGVELTPSELAQIIGIAQDVDHPRVQVRVWQAASPHLSQQAARQALPLIAAFPDLRARLLCTLALAARLAEPERTQRVSEVLSVASRATDPWLRADVRRRAALLADVDRGDEFRRSLADIRSIDQEDERAAALSIAVAELPASLFDEVFALTCELGDAHSRQVVLQELGFQLRERRGGLDLEMQWQLFHGATSRLSEIGSSALVEGLVSLGDWLDGLLSDEDFDEHARILKDLARRRW